MFWTIILGGACGLRTLTPIAVVCWAAYLGYLPVQGTWAFWTAKLVTVIVVTVLALGEYVVDTLPSTPSRTELPLVLGRVSFGVLVGVVIATALGQPKAGGVILGFAGALIGTYGGYRIRMAGARWMGRDLPMALFGSAMALGLSMLAARHVHQEIALYAGRAATLLQTR